MFWSRGRVALQAYYNSKGFLVLAVGFVAFRMPSFGFSHPGLLSISGYAASFEGIQGLVSCTRYVHDHVVCVCCRLQAALGFWNFMFGKFGFLYHFFVCVGLDLGRFHFKDGLCLTAFPSVQMDCLQLYHGLLGNRRGFASSSMVS